MRALSAMDLLDLADRADGLHPVDRGLAMLRTALPERTYGELARLSLGERDSLLLELRRLTFGEEMSAYAECGACGERLEFSTSCHALLAENAEGARAAIPDVVSDGYRVGLRRLDSLDLAAIAGCTDVAQARGALVARCIAEIDGPRGVARAEDLPDGMVAALVDALGQGDPQAEVLLELSCPACGHTWQAQLDIGRFLWTEIRVRARRLLGEVHVIARAYGWRESDILAMSERRRTAYVDLALRGAPS